MQDDNPIYAPFFGVMGAASAIIFSGEFQLFEFLDESRWIWFEHLNEQSANAMIYSLYNKGYNTVIVKTYPNIGSSIIGTPFSLL